MPCGDTNSYLCFETAKLMFCRICYPTAKNIRIFDPRLIPINQKIGSNRIKKLAVLTFGSDIHFRPIFRCAQQLVQISRHISLLGSFRTHYVSIWIFHSSLLTLHFRQAFFTFNFSFLFALLRLLFT